MTKLLIIPTILLSLVSFPSWSETMDDLVERDGLFYKKFSDVPFTGAVEGRRQGMINNGKREGRHVEYFSNGLLNKESSGFYRNDVKISD